MKKPYVAPFLMVLPVELDNLICGSVNSSNDIDYGGVDEDGELDPSSNGSRIWDDDSWGSL